MPTTYSRKVRWSDINANHKIEVTGHVNKENALIHCYCVALSHGWRPRRWWQFWRWLDTPNPSLEEVLTAASKVFEKYKEATGGRATQA